MFIFFSLRRFSEISMGRDPNHLQTRRTKPKWNQDKSDHKNVNPGMQIKQNTKLGTQKQKWTHQKRHSSQTEHKFCKNQMNRHLSLYSKGFPEKTKSLSSSQEECKVLYSVGLITKQKVKLVSLYQPLPNIGRPNLRKDSPGQKRWGHGSREL